MHLSARGDEDDWRTRQTRIELFARDDNWLTQDHDGASSDGLAVFGAPGLQNPLNTIDFHFVQAGAPNIKVYFAVAGQTFDGVTAEQGWNAAERAAALAAFAAYSAVTPLTFTAVTSAATANIVLTLATLDDTLLGQMNTVGGVGYGAFNLQGSGWDAAGLAPGGQGFVTLVHEFGHALGLAHPHDNGGGSEIMDGVTGPFGSYGTYGLNRAIYTTMSYNEDFGSAAWGLQAGPMALDVGLLQLKYGVNPSANAGNTTYIPSALLPARRLI